MALNELKDAVPEQDNTSAGLTNVRLDTGLVADLKKEVGVSQNNEVAPVVAIAVAKFMNDSDRAEEYEEQFKAQFEDE